jgi:photosystem II stability/assembly factor-like uncharacterized protein
MHHTHTDRPHSGWRARALIALTLGLLGLALALPAGALAAGGWSAQTSGATANLRAVAFVNPSVGWAVGDDGALLATTNGGATWQAQASGPTDRLTSVAATDASDAWVVSEGGSVLVTTNGGATWNAKSSDVPGSLGVFGVAFANPTDGWLVGGDGTIGATTDGGGTWTQQNTSTAERLTGVTFTDATHGWAVGDEGTILATTDGGKTWIAQSSGMHYDLAAVAFANAHDGWAVGLGGTVLATTDGGATWVAQSSGTAFDLTGVAFANATDGWAVGLGGTVLATTDGGATWVAQSSGTKAPLYAVAVATTSDAWAVGLNGTILATTDGGYPVPTISSLAPSSGTVGGGAVLGGTGFTGATKVTFHGVSASFIVKSDTQITAIVPAGATSGTVSVTTPGGTAVSATSFIVNTPLPVAATPTLRLQLSGLTAGAVRLGKRLTAEAIVRPANLEGSRVTLTVERKHGGSWRKVVSKVRTTGAGGTCRWAYGPTKRGSYRVRCAIAKSAANLAATTTWRAFKVK